MWRHFNKEQYLKFIKEFILIDIENINDKDKVRTLFAVNNNIESHYKKYIIPKRSGGSRKLFVPDYLLKKIQTNILHNILEQHSISKYAFAYHKNLSIIDNAFPHINKKIILKLDIKDFFNSITFEMIYNNAFPNIYYPNSIRTLLSNLCCYNFSLPQGAPTSGYISNLVMKNFDEYIGKWCEDNNIIYTRYCDDMTFSGDFNPNKVKNKVKNFLRVLGFELNEKKTKILNHGMAQNITGIIVNQKIQVPKKYRNKIRQEVYYIKKYGINSHIEKLNLKISSNEYLVKLLGKINFILNVNSNDKEFISGKNYIQSLINIPIKPKHKI